MDRLASAVAQNCDCLWNDDGAPTWQCNAHYWLMKYEPTLNRLMNMNVQLRLRQEMTGGPRGSEPEAEHPALSFSPWLKKD